MLVVLFCMRRCLSANKIFVKVSSRTPGGPALPLRNTKRPAAKYTTGRRKAKQNSFPFLSSGLYRRPRNHTGSAAASAAGRGLAGHAAYRRWGIAPRPETDFLALSIAQVLQIARGCAIIDKNKFGDWVVFPCCLVHSGGLGQYRIILSADTASEVRQMLSQKRR